jgi:hypothetical protein
MMHPAWRAILGPVVLTTIPIYQHIALEFLKWMIKTTNKIRRAFVWEGRKEVHGGHCLGARGWVKRQIDLGGLRILD